MPAIKKSTGQISEQINKTDFSSISGKVQQAVNSVKQKVNNLKKSNENNKISINVTTKDAQKQVTQLQKQIDSLNQKINARRTKLEVITPQLDNIMAQTTKQVTPEGISSDNPAIQKTINNSLNSNKDYTSLASQETKITSEISTYNKQLEEAKTKMEQLKQEINQTGTSQNKLTSFFSSFKNKISQAKTETSGLKKSFSKIPSITNNVSNHIKNMGSGLKQGIGHVMRYAMALFSLRGVYSVLSNCASTWLSSQNAGAKQLSVNIEYMKYAMGSALAPVIQFVTNLVYQLMKAVQSVVYALIGVNIFAKASASSYNSMANSAKKAKEETNKIANFDEISNIQKDNNSDSGSDLNTPSFDLSNVNPTNSILDAIKSGNWYEVGATIGEKLNDAMNSIPWDKIQNTAKKIGIGIAQFLNGFIATTDWNQVGNTFAQGINAVIDFGYSFVTTFDWKQFGTAIGDSINGLFKNIDWATAGQTLSEGIKGAFTSIYTALEEIDWQQIARDVEEFVKNIDWGGVVYAIIRGIAAGFIGLGIIIGTWIGDAIQSAKQYFEQKIEECGGNIVAGILKGIIDGLVGIGQWIYDNMIRPIIDAFCSLLGIHSPSTVFARIWAKYNSRTT